MTNTMIGVGMRSGNILKTFNCNSFAVNDSLIHFIKCSNNLLPTIDNLRIRSHLYNNIQCPMCQEEEESLLHLMICNGTAEGFEIVEREVTQKILKSIKKFNSKSTITYEALQKVIFEYKDEAFPLLISRNRLELTRGLISTTITKN